MSTKIDTSTIYEMFETQKSELAELKKLIINTATPTEKNEAATNAITRLMERVVEEVKKPAKVEYRHTFDIRNSWFFFSWVALVIIILGLFWIMGNQRQTITEFRNNDLKYRYIRMQGQANEESLFRLQEQFQHADSIKTIRNRVERFEDLVREQAERLERARINEEERERLQRAVDDLRMRSK